MDGVARFLQIADITHYGGGFGNGDGGGGLGNGGGGGGLGNGGGGSGGGCGYGGGCGIGRINQTEIYDIDDVQTAIYHIHGNVAKGAILRQDLTFTPCYIVKNENYFAHGETLKKANSALMTKVFNNMDTEDKIKAFNAEFNENTKYPNKMFYEWHNKLTGSCEMGRRQFAENHNIDIDNGEMTVNEFLQLTKNTYGGEVIRQIIGR